MISLSCCLQQNFQKSNLKMFFLIIRGERKGGLQDGGEADDDGGAAETTVGGAEAELDTVLDEWIRCARYLFREVQKLRIRRHLLHAVAV